MRIYEQTVRTNEQMMQAMKGATGVLGSMNRSMNLPALTRIAMEFEKENDIMDQRQEMMDDAIDDVTGLEDEAEGEEVVEQVLEELGLDLKNSVGDAFSFLAMVDEGKGNFLCCYYVCVCVCRYSYAAANCLTYFYFGKREKLRLQI